MSQRSGNHMAHTGHARERYPHGKHLPGELFPDVIARSWQRCVDRKVNPARKTGDIPMVAAGALAGFRERSRRLIVHSQPVMDQLHEQICGTSSVVVLTDATGVVLHSVGDHDFMAQAERATLHPGGIWTEEANGTNAIGTALVEQVPVLVHNAQHFLEVNHFLTCSASPIFDPHGRMLGVLDVSGDCDAYQRHTMALVRMSAQMIENQFFAHECNEHILLHFHLRQEFIGTLYEGIAVFSLDGRFVAGNRAALFQLGLDRYDAEKRDFNSIFSLSLARLFEQARILPQPMIRLRQHNGVEVYGRVKFGTSVSPITYLPIRQADAAESPPGKTGGTETPLSLAALGLGDPAMGAAIRKATKVIGHAIPLMIEGESGSGKEMFARAFHAAGPRRNGPFIAINCAAIPEGLIESELFGYKDGAFTGARRSGSVGKIQQADGGTLFLDEISDMPASLQARLLRVLQDRTVTPLGGSKATPVDITVICATNRRLRDEVAAGRFREDLYYRLNGLIVTVPPLRHRVDRIPLAMEILRSLAGERNRIFFSPRVLDIFEKHPWPGNIRQLANVLRTAIALSDGDEEIGVDHLPEDFLDQAPFMGASASESRASARTTSGSLEELEEAAIRNSLRESGGNVSAAARRLGISRNTLYRRLKAADFDTR
jgi:sigma-54 dependent transcriptional regulator, acetoin dehydrogenase operon transcriptional activator AcoR